MQNPNNLINKLNRVFLLQGGLIAIAAILSVFFATKVINNILINEAIQQEANYFWKHYDLDNSFPLPNTSNLTAYFDKELIPDDIKSDTNLIAGFNEFETEQGKFVLYVSKKHNKTLYLLYNRGDVDYLATYYGLVPLTLVLVALYLALWFAYRFSHRAISPITWLAKQVNQFDLSSTDFSAVKKERLPFDADGEIQILSDAILHLGERLEAFISRERNFTRDASHELRSPLTVINIAADMLLSEQELPPPAKNSVMRIKRASADMEELTKAFLLLARESDHALSNEIICINEILEEEIERAMILVEDKPLTINYQADFRIKLWASNKVLSILLGNLIRNAVLYTDEGNIDILLKKNSVLIKDSGQGIPEQKMGEIFKPYYRGKSDNTGYGVGLTIVKRLSDRFNWPITIDSTVGTGTTIEIKFPDSESHKL